MPELPEVETVRRGLQPVMEGARILSVEPRRPDLRFPLPERFDARLRGRRIVSVGRRAKYLVLETEGGPSLICHLGMSGSFRIETAAASTLPGDFVHARSKDTVHDHVVFHLETGTGEPTRIVFNDPRRFGFMMLFDGAARDHPMLSGLGIEPTGNALDGAALKSLFDGRRTPLKAALLDQRLIAGLGNIYVCEALWRAGLSPFRQAGSLARPGRRNADARATLAASIRSVIAEAIEAGGSSLRDYVHTDGSLGYFQHSFSVYGREGEICRTPGCGTPILRTVQAGRSTFSCPRCQK